MKYKTLYTTFLLSFLSILTFSQVTINLGTDTTVCENSTVTITNPVLNPNGVIVLNNPTSISLTDDSYSGIINIGFSFDFYGNTYTQLVIGSNGIVSFNLGNANGFCPWALTGVGPLPNAGFATAQNAIMPVYHDINPSNFASPNGDIFYQTIGTAPNRIFIVTWKDITMFGNNNQCTYTSLILYETSNIIEAHIGNKPIANSGWNGQLAIQATENAGGTIAHPTPGRNNTIWTAISDGKRWTPTSPTNTSNYTISTVPYILILSGNSATNVQWESTTGQTYPYNNGVLNVTATNTTVGYFLSGVTCGQSLGAISDTSFITGVSVTVSAVGTDDICSAGLGTATATGSGGTLPYSYQWNDPNNQTTQTATGLTAGTYTVTITDGMGCTSTANVTIGDTPATFSGDSTLVSCPGGNDGTATAYMTPQLGNVITYQWDDPNNQTTQTATGLSAGTYNCIVTSDIGCQSTVTVTVTEIPGMVANTINTVDATCNSLNDGIIEIAVTDGTPPYSYSWDNSNSTTNIANDLLAGTHTITITDANGCVITHTETIGEPPALDITFITPDTMICPENAITLQVSGTGGSSPYTFTWTTGGQTIGTGTSIVVDPDVTNTVYCAELSEACGSPTDQECVNVYFPTPIVPSAIPDTMTKCVPDTFYFTNTSTNANEIATTFWEYGDRPTHNELVNGAQSVAHYYDAIGFHDITMTITSIYGCVYTDTMKNLIEVLPSPIADFNFSKNPTTIFETNILMQDKSSYDVVNWYWTATGGQPTTSTQQNPTFHFPEGEEGIYPITLVVETDRGCTDTVKYNLHVVQDVLFFAPNAFTPDGDEHNQIWKPIINGIDIYDFELLIFNRWGEVIWENHDPNVGWDGTYNGRIVPNDTYTWIAKVKLPNSDEKRTYKGHFVLLKGNGN